MESITYLVTNYNNESYVGSCLQSIIEQTNSNWRCIVVDDCSKDGSVKEIEKYLNSKISLIKNDENIGQIKSLIKALEYAETDIVAIVDSDDMIETETTEEVLSAYNKSPRIGMVYTNCIEYDEKMQVPLYIGLSQRLSFGPASSIVFGYVSSLRSFRLSQYKNTEGYNLDLLYAEDLDLMYKLEEICLPYFINKHLYRYRNIENSRSRAKGNIQIGIINHYKAKKQAIVRRKPDSLLAGLMYLYIYSEFRAAMNKHAGNNFRKKLYQSLERITKFVLQLIVFRSIQI